MEETIHIFFNEKKKDLIQNIDDLEEDLENFPLNNNQSSLQIATRDGDKGMANNLEFSLPHHVSNDMPKNFKASPIRRYTTTRDLRVVSQN